MINLNELTVKHKSGKTLLENITFSLDKGECLGLTGASGAGKTTILRTVLGLLGSGVGITLGSVSIDERDVSTLDEKEKRAMRGKTLGFIPQSPMTAFDDRLTIGKQMIETLKIHGIIENAKELALNSLRDVGLLDAQRVFDSCSLQLSGGMLQRVCVALLLVLNPKYIIADEPTAALDNENKMLLLSLLRERLNESAILIVTHDPDVLKTLCDEVIVLENGKIIEHTNELFENPKTQWSKEFVNASKLGEEQEFTWTESLQKI